MTTTSIYKFCLLVNKSAKHLNISTSKIFFSIIKSFNKLINCSVQISKVSFLINWLKVPKLTNNAFLMSLLAFVVRFLLLYSKKLLIYLLLKISLFIWYNSGINFINSTRIE